MNIYIYIIYIYFDEPTNIRTNHPLVASIEGSANGMENGDGCPMLPPRHCLKRTDVFALLIMSNGAAHLVLHIYILYEYTIWL